MRSRAFLSSAPTKDRNVKRYEILQEKWMHSIYGNSEVPCTEMNTGFGCGCTYAYWRPTTTSLWSLRGPSTSTVPEDEEAKKPEHRIRRAPVPSTFHSRAGKFRKPMTKAQLQVARGQVKLVLSTQIKNSTPLAS